MSKNASKADVQIRPLGDRALIKPEKGSEETTTSGIILPDSGEAKQDRGTVVAVGPGKVGDDNELIPMSVKQGDTVLFQWGDKVEYGGEEYYLVTEGNILAVID